MVDKESDGEMAVSNGVELEVEENEVAIPIPPPGRCYIRIPKESGRGWAQKVRGSEARLADSY